MNPIVAARTALWEAQGSSRRDHAQAPLQRSGQGFPGAPGRNCEQRLLSPSGCPGTASASASTPPSEAPPRRFFAVRQNRTTLLFLSCINGRLIPARFFINHLLQTPRRRFSPTSGREACSASISSHAKTTAGLGRKKSPEAGVFEAKYAPCAAAVRRFRRLLQCIIQTPSGSQMP